MSEPAVLYERDGGVVRLTLNRPDNRNAMTPEMLGAFTDALDRLDADDEARVVVIAGTGSSFCAGADFRSSLLEEIAAPGDHYPVYAPFLRVLELDLPVIGALTGHAVGGGFGLALTCDIRIASEHSRYGANFVRLGLGPGMGISYLLPRIVGTPRALEYLLTGRLFDGAEGARIGFANVAVPADDVIDVALTMATEIAGASPTAVALTKRLVYRGLDVNPIDHARREAVDQAWTASLPDFAEGVEALLEKRPPRFDDVPRRLPED